MDDVLTAEQVAEMLHLKRNTIYQLVAKHSIPYHRVGGERGALRFIKAEIIEYIKQS